MSVMGHQQPMCGVRSKSAFHSLATVQTCELRISKWLAILTPGHKILRHLSIPLSMPEFYLWGRLLGPGRAPDAKMRGAQA